MQRDRVRDTVNLNNLFHAYVNLCRTTCSDSTVDAPSQVAQRISATWDEPTNAAPQHTPEPLQSKRYEKLGLVLAPGLAVRPGYGQESDTMPGVYNSQIMHMDMATLAKMAEEGCLVQWVPGCSSRMKEARPGAGKGAERLTARMDIWNVPAEGVAPEAHVLVKVCCALRWPTQ
jgi:hypothetical protein